MSPVEQVLLDNGSVRYSGDASAFAQSPHLASVLGTTADNEEEAATAKEPALPAMNGRPPPVNKAIKQVRELNGTASETSSASEASTDEESESESEDEDEDDDEVKAPRKLIEDEARAVGHVDSGVWSHYVAANGGLLFWSLFCAAFVGSRLIEVGETWVLRIWSGSYDGPQDHAAHTTNFYLALYAAFAISSVLFETGRYLILYHGVRARGRFAARRHESMPGSRSPPRPSSTSSSSIRCFAHRCGCLTPFHWVRGYS
jgi:hypothetical protein